VPVKVSVYPAHGLAGGVLALGPRLQARPVLFAVGVGLLAASTAYSAYDRYFNQDQSGLQALLGGAADATGISAVYAGITGRDLATQHHLSLTPAQQRQMLTEGSIQIGALVLPSILKAGGRLFAQGRAPVAPVRGARAGGGILGAAAGDSRLVWSSAAGDVVVDGASLPGRTGMAVSRRLTAAEMEGLQLSHGVEFALIYELGPGPGGGGGRYLLFSGGPTNVWFPPNGNYIWISHTHPAGYPLRASTADQNWLRLMQTNGSPQRTSTVVPLDGDPFRFNPTNRRLP